jgi:hypothetical protein
VAFFPDKLYQLLRADVAGSLLLPHFDKNIGVSGTTNATAATIVPSDKFLLLQNAGARAQPGAAQVCYTTQILIATPLGDGTTRSFSLTGQAIAAGTTDMYTQWAGSVIVPPNWRIFATSAFTFVAANNTLTLDVAGVLIPRGSIARI